MNALQPKEARRVVDLDGLADRISYKAVKSVVEALPSTPGQEPSTAFFESVSKAYEEAIDPETPDSDRSPRLDKRLYGLFKLLSDEQRGRAYWHRLCDDMEQIDRNRVVLALWDLIERRYAKTVEEIGSSVQYHRAWLFDWCLRRYDLRSARRAVGGGWVAANAHVFLLLAVGGLFALRRFPYLPLTRAWTWALAVVLVYALVTVVLAWSFRRRLSSDLEATKVVLHSLVPRLAGASVVGLLLLASSQDLLRFVTTGMALPWLGLTLAAGYAYLLIEMMQRIHPLPPVRRLAALGFDIGATALCHALALTLVAERGLVKILDSEAWTPLDSGAAASVAVFLFIIGLVVNLIWAETPVTEPL